MNKNKTSKDVQNDIEALQEQIKKMKKEQRKLEKQEQAEREKIERQKQIEEALVLIEIAKNQRLQSGQTFYDFLKEKYAEQSK